MLSTDRNDGSRDESAQEKLNEKLNEVLCGATDAISDSVKLWNARINHLLETGQEEKAESVFSKVIDLENY